MTHQTFNSETESLYQDISEALQRNHTVDVFDAWLVLQKITKQVQAQLDTHLAFEHIKNSGAVDEMKSMREQP